VVGLVGKISHRPVKSCKKRSIPNLVMIVKGPELIGERS
jgi:hypothetical protein